VWPKAVDRVENSLPDSKPGNAGLPKGAIPHEYELRNPVYALRAPELFFRQLVQREFSDK